MFVDIMVDVSFEDRLRARLEKHNAYFNDLIKVIPAKYYIPAKDDEQQNGSWVWQFVGFGKLDAKVR
jgi:hypothetical protein